MKIKSLILTTYGLLLPSLVFAQGLSQPNKPIGLPGAPGDTVGDVLYWIINLALAIVGLVSVGFLIYGGFQYVTSAGNAETAEAAKKTIQNSVIGLIVVILSYTIVVVVINAIARSHI